MKLAELEPRFLVAGATHFPHVEDLATAQGIMFLCPLCYTKNDGPVGTHEILIWFEGRGVDPKHVSSPNRWAVSGTGIEDLTLSPSVDLSNAQGVGCQWHGRVVDGKIK